MGPLHAQPVVKPLDKNLIVYQPMNMPFEGHIQVTEQLLVFKECKTQRVMDYSYRPVSNNFE